MPKYRVAGGPDGNAGLSYKSKRVEVGEIVDDLPRESIKWLREQGYIEPLNEETKAEKVEIEESEEEAE